MGDSCPCQFLSSFVGPVESLSVSGEDTGPSDGASLPKD